MSRPQQQDQPPGEEISQQQPSRKRSRREATIYDACAGRVQSRGFLPSPTRTSTGAISHTPVAPEEVLFRRKNAPQRYEEDDIYFQSRFLPRGGEELPSSELLKAVHAYASDFYGALERRAGGEEGSGVDWGSLDGSALLAVGVLLEEQCREELGRTGHLALLEEVGGEDEGEGGELVWNGRAWVTSVLRHPRKRVKRAGINGKADEGEGTENDSDDSNEQDDDESNDASSLSDGDDGVDGHEDSENDTGSTGHSQTSDDDQG